MGRKGEVRRAESGGGVFGEGQPAHPHQLWGLCPAAEGFSCILCRQIAFPGISVRVAYSLHG